MKITVLDGYTLNPGDLDWNGLQALGSVKVYDRTSPEEILSHAQGAEILLSNKTILTDEVMGNLPSLRYIGVLATGYDVIDIEAARRRNIAVTNVPAYGAASVAQMVFAHILNITNNVAGHSHDVARGGWGKTEDYCYWLTPQTELADKVMGIIGYGEIGRATAELARAFSMKVLIHTRTIPQSLPENISHVQLEELLSLSDIISLHCPLTEHTRELINEDTLSLMKDSALLINCSRGPLVKESALAEALNNGTIKAAGLDVLTQEPLKSDTPLLQAKNCFITPHIAWATREARARLLATAVANLEAFLEGKRKNRLT
ncbi:MAG: D-2-hydroxyacid dehydrogenase [Desulfopila sp.]|jgi:glycerate dehydrogenase|nr:D-2-hydroxyacid dehydrogenase [Desulfopila sp.]